MPGLEKTLNFDTPGNFIFDATKIEVSTGDAVARLLQNPDLTFAALFATTGQLNAEVANGDPTASPSGAGTLVWHGLDCRGAAIKGVSYAGTGNADGMIQAGTIRTTFIPNFTGSPAATQFIYDQFGPGDINDIRLRWTAAGFLQIFMTDSSGVIQLNNLGFGSITTAVQNVPIEFEIDFDVTLGAIRLFVDGAQSGVTNTTTFTRSASVTTISLCSAGSQLSDAVLEEAALFNTVKHISGYVPSTLNVTDPDLAFAAQYRTFSIDADIGGGDLTGTAIGAVRVVHGLDLEGGAGAGTHFIDYSAALNVDNIVQQGTFRFTVIPNYSGGSPGTLGSRLFHVTKSSISRDNEIRVLHDIAGTITVVIRDRFGAFLVNALFGSWTAVAGVPTQHEFNFNIDTGDVRYFLDGVLIGSQTGITGTRLGAQIGEFRIGGDRVTPPNQADFFIRDFACFSTVQHTADFTDESILVSTDDPPIKPGTSDDIDSFNGINAVITAVAPDEIRTVQEINSQNMWFNGVAWVNSDGSLAQSNTFADADANADLLDVSQGVRYRSVTLIHSDDGVSTPSIASLTFQFDFFAFEADQPDVRTCVVFGFVADASEVPQANVRVCVFHDTFFHGSKVVKKPLAPVAVFTDANGFFEIAVIETQTIAKSPYIFKVGTQEFKKVQVPDLISAALADFVT